MTIEKNEVEVSVLIPIFNEFEAIGPLIESLSEVLDQTGKTYEVLLIDDGSTDGTGKVLKEYADKDSKLKVIQLRRNFGQTAAIMAGINHSNGAVLVPIDGDGQNDPGDIPHLLAELDQGYDVVSGWRKKRKDPFLTRVLVSRIANSVISWISGVKLHDFGCTLKAYRRDVLEDVNIYGEMHRFIPIYARWQGASVSEIAVRHHRRMFGKSKYGLGRVVKVLLDLVVIRFLERYSSNPIHLFGWFGAINLMLAFASAVYAFWLKFGEGISFIDTPLPMLFVLFFLIGIVSVLLGLLAEMIMRTYFESQGKKPYSVKKTANIEPSE